MILAELHIFHSRPIAPTRRVALGEVWLPTDPAPGFGGLLLATIVGKYANELGSDDERDDLRELIDDLLADRAIPQPRLRHRFQEDVVGLVESSFALVESGRNLGLEFVSRGTPAQQILGAAYAAKRVPFEARPFVFSLVDHAMKYTGIGDENLLAYLTIQSNLKGHWTVRAEDRDWALTILGFTPAKDLTKGEVVRRFRELVRGAHPDQGGASIGASGRVADLTRAKSILLASS